MFWVITGLVVFNGIGAVFFMVDARLSLVLLFGLVAVAVSIKNPLFGVGLLIAGRLTSTGANAWVRIGKINVDLFEPSLMLALGALLTHTILQKKMLAKEVPWRVPVVAFAVFQFISLFWTTNLGEGAQEFVATIVLLCTTFVVMSFITEWKHVRWMLALWVAVSFAIGFLSMLGIGDPSEESFEMAQGNRSGGFGQHPNWFAMNLMYSVTVAFAFGFIEKHRGRAALWYLAGLGIFLFQMASGSRGGTGAILIGAGIAGLFHPGMRRTLLKWGIVGLIGVTFVIVFYGGGLATAFSRIWIDSTGTMLGAGVREQNWLVCFQMFIDTWGLGIGGGGYADLLLLYNNWLGNSLYTYPHGIFWGMMAHYGIVGIFIWSWFLLIIARMTKESVIWTIGHEYQPIILAMFGAMVGYFCWSFFEFMYDDKPFWEYLGIFTVMWMLAKKLHLKKEEEAKNAKNGVQDPTESNEATAL